jgi:outer membrane lipoprotein-sorting protein
MMFASSVLSALLLLFFLVGGFPPVPQKTLAAQADPRVLDLAGKMESAFKSVKSYTCQVEQIFFKNGSEDQRSDFTFHFKQDRNIRVDFTHPYPSLTLIYIEGEDKATILPFRAMPLVKFRFSIHDSILKTPAGQRIDQTDMGYFIRFLLKNLESTEQGDADFREDEQEATFSLWAMDYISGKQLERYRITLSKTLCLPTRIERYDREGNPLEKTVIRNYTINTPLEEELFHP